MGREAKAKEKHGCPHAPRKTGGSHSHLEKIALGLEKDPSLPFWERAKNVFKRALSSTQILSKPRLHNRVQEEKDFPPPLHLFKKPGEEKENGGKDPAGLSPPDSVAPAREKKGDVSVARAKAAAACSCCRLSLVRLIALARHLPLPPPLQSRSAAKRGRRRAEALAAASFGRARIHSCLKH